MDTLEEPSEGPAEDPDSLSLAAPLSIVIDGRTFEGTAQLQIVEIPGAFSAILSAQGAVGDDIVRFGQALGATALRRFGKGENVILPGDSVLMYGAHDSDYGVLRSIRAIVVDERLQLDVTFEYSAPIAGASAGALVATGQLDIMCMVRAPGGDDGTMLVDAALQTDVCRRTVRGHGLAHLIPHQVVEAP